MFHLIKCEKENHYQLFAVESTLKNNLASADISGCDNVCANVVFLYCKKISVIMWVCFHVANFL